MSFKYLFSKENEKYILGIVFEVKIFSVSKSETKKNGFEFRKTIKHLGSFSDEGSNPGWISEGLKNLPVEDFKMKVVCYWCFFEFRERKYKAYQGSFKSVKRK